MMTKITTAERPRVLIVCINDVDADKHKQLFADLGCEPTNAWNPDHAIEIVQSFLKYDRHFDLVCVDYILHGMNGITLARNLKAMDPALFFHMFSSYYQDTKIFIDDFADFGGFLYDPSDSYDTFYRLSLFLKDKKVRRKRTLFPQRFI